MKHISNVTIAKADQGGGTNVFDFLVSLFGGTPVTGESNIFDVIATVINKG